VAERTENYTNEFNTLVDKYCDPRQNDNIECLKVLGDLDSKIKSKQSFNNEFTKCNDCLPNDDSNGQKTYFYHHTFWQISDQSVNEFNKRVLKLQIKSFLSTQNLCCTRLIIWKLSTFDAKLENELRIKFSYYIKQNILIIKEFKFKELCSHKNKMFYSSFADHQICLNSIWNQKLLLSSGLVSLSDFIRFLCLIYTVVCTPMAMRFT
jgi:hypothetical protein